MGEKKCLMVERTLLTKESHGSLASSQRSHERCGHSPQHSLNHVLPAAQHASGHLIPQGQQLSEAKSLFRTAHSGCLAPREGEGTVRNDARDLGEQPFPLTSPRGHARHGGEEGDGDSDAVFQMRRNHAVFAACGQKESLKVMTQHLHCVFSF